MLCSVIYFLFYLTGSSIYVYYVRFGRKVDCNIYIYMEQLLTNTGTENLISAFIMLVCVSFHSY
jgi:hypothetical protein